MKLRLDYSALSTWRSCPTKFMYRYVQGLTGQQSSEALDFGKIFHLGLEYLYKNDFPALGYGADELIVKAVTEAAGTSIANIAPEQRRSTAHLELLLQRYVDNYQPERLKLVQFEQHVEAPINDWLTYCGTIDGVTADGSVFETKTTSFLGTSFLNRMAPNDQATGYLWLLRSIPGGNDKADRIVFNGASTSGYGLKGPASGWPINKNPHELFSRAETFRTEEQIEDWKARLIKDAQRILEDINTGSFGANAPDACTAFNSMCPFADICRARSANRATLIKNAYKVEPWKGFKHE